MNGLFLRIYVLVMVATLATVAGVSVIVFNQILPNRNAELVTAVAPPLRELATRMEAGEAPSVVLDDAMSIAGPHLALIPSDVLPLGADDVKALRQGDVVVSGSDLERYAYVWVPSQRAAIELELTGLRNRANQWIALVARGAQLGGEAEGLVAQPGPPPDALTAARGRWRTVSEDALAPVSASNAVWFQGDDGQWYRVGVPVVGPQDVRMYVIAGMLLLTAIAILFALAPVHRQLTALGRAADDLSGGDLDARVLRLRGGGPVHTLADQFNGMALRVQDTIRGNEELLRSVSHEMRTPVARLLFSLDLLDGDGSPEERAERVAQMRATVGQMQELTDELLSFARLGQTSPELDRSEVDLTELVDDIAAKWDGTDVRRPDAAAVVHGDARLLMRVLDNLVGNAVRYASPPTVTLERAGETWTVHVDDDGSGIPEAERGRIFDPFVRLEASRSRDTGGSGLGLAICARVVRAHGGTLEVGDGPRGGARFSVTLPAGG